MSSYDLVIRGGRVANPDHETQGAVDVAVAEGRILAVDPEIDPGRAASVIEAGGRWVLPGLIDPHVHLSGMFGKPIGCRMLARAGVTTALDLAGQPSDLLAQLPLQGCGLTIGVLVPVVPGLTIDGRDPSTAEIDRLLDRSLAYGALGLKALGGHFPITPDALARVISACHRRGAYCAVHAGTTETGSDVRGLEELLTLRDGEPVHVAHVNSYCRGQIDDPVVEAGRAIAALRDTTGAMAESYLAVINGAMATCTDGVPDSNVVKTCLRMRGYPPTLVALQQAIADGWAQIHVEEEDGIRLAGPDEGRTWFDDHGTCAGVSFAVNSPAAALAIALARRADRGFVVGGVGSDGGAFPRNTTLRQALALVQAGWLTMSELVEKTSTCPARMLGLPSKGRLAAGADADVVVAARDGSVRVVVIGGQVVIRDGELLAPQGGTLLCHAAGHRAAKGAGIAFLTSAR